MSNFPRASLKPYRREAEQYYQSPEYLAQVATLNEIIRSVADRLAKLRIALDLEGTLTSLNLQVHYRPHDHFDSLDRLRRPFAQEMLALLDATSKQLMIWSSAPPKCFAGVIRSSCLAIPARTTRKHRTHYSDAFCRSPAIEEKVRAAFSGRELQGVLDTIIFSGIPKIPSVMGVDFLLDDFALKDRPLLMRIDPLEARKMLDVPPFTIENLHQLELHHRDTGLLDACERLAERAIGV